MVQHFNQTGDAAAAHYLSELCSGQSGVSASLHLILPGVVDSAGHVPNQLQDFLLQVFGGYRLASSLDAAATHFKNFGGWPQSISVHDDMDAELEESGLVLSNQRVASNNAALRVSPVRLAFEACAYPRPLGNNLEPRSSSEPPPVARYPLGEVCASGLIEVPQLHEHACSRHTSSRFGAQRTCSLCNNRTQREREYIRCSRGCRFVACASCVWPGADPLVNQNHADVLCQLTSHINTMVLLMLAGVKPGF